MLHLARHCEQLPPTQNAVIVGDCRTEYLSICRMECYAGYEAVGSKERKCGVNAFGAMEWSGSPLTCVGK